MSEAAPPATAPRGGRRGSVSTAAAATAADEGVPTPSAEEIPAVPGSEPEQQTSQPEPEPEQQVALTEVLADEDAPSTPRLSET